MLLKADVFTLLQLGSSRTLQKAWKNYVAKKKKLNQKRTAVNIQLRTYFLYNS